MHWELLKPFFSSMVATGLTQSYRCGAAQNKSTNGYFFHFSALLYLLSLCVIVYLLWKWVYQQVKSLLGHQIKFTGQTPLLISNESKLTLHWSWKTILWGFEGSLQRQIFTTTIVMTILSSSTAQLTAVAPHWAPQMPWTVEEMKVSTAKVRKPCV